MMIKFVMVKDGEKIRITVADLFELAETTISQDGKEALFRAEKWLIDIPGGYIWRVSFNKIEER